MDLYYKNIKDEVEVFTKCFEKNLPLLLKGPTGCGKSQLVHFMAQKLKRPIVTVACNEDTSATDLLGRFLIKGQDTVWQDGPVTRAIKLGAILYLDEIAEAREDVIVAIHPLTDNRRILYLDKINETLSAPNNFMVVASFNPGYQSSFKEMKPSTRQRFVTYAMNYPEESDEVEIVQKVSGLEKKNCELLVKFANKVRKLEHLSLKETVSTRLLVQAAALILSGLNQRLACHVAIVESLTDDPQITLGLNELVNLTF